MIIEDKESKVEIQLRGGQSDIPRYFGAHRFMTVFR